MTGGITILYEIHFYKDKNGKEPVLEYMKKLAGKKDKDILLHQFMKKTQKTPAREIEKAKKELADLKERGIDNE